MQVSMNIKGACLRYDPDKEILIAMAIVSKVLAKYLPEHGDLILGQQGTFRHGSHYGSTHLCIYPTDLWFDLDIDICLNQNP